MLWKKQPVGSKIADLQTNKASKDAATQSAAGLMYAADKTKLDGIATGATAVSVVNNLNSDSTTSALSAAQGKALNSNLGVKTYGMSIDKMTTIPNNTDLNIYTTPGSYYCPNAATAATLSNSPVTTGGFSLHVESVGGGTGQNIIQTVKQYGTATMNEFTRTYTPTTWSGWNSLNSQRGGIGTDITSDTFIMGLMPGTYNVNAPATAVTNGYIPERWGTLTVNKSGENYNSCIFISTSNKTYFRAYNSSNSTWYGAWQEIALKSDTSKSIINEYIGNEKTKTFTLDARVVYLLAITEMANGNIKSSYLAIVGTPESSSKTGLINWVTSAPPSSISCTFDGLTLTVVTNGTWAVIALNRM